MRSAHDSVMLVLIFFLLSLLPFQVYHTSAEIIARIPFRTRQHLRGCLSNDKSQLRDTMREVINLAHSGWIATRWQATDEELELLTTLFGTDRADRQVAHNAFTFVQAAAQRTLASFNQWRPPSTVDYHIECYDQRM